MQEDLTDARMNEPRTGDEFHDMHSFFVVVVKREGDKVYVAEATQKEETYRVFANLASFRMAYAYSEIPGYWIRYSRTYPGLTFDMNVFKNLLEEDTSYVPGRERWEAIT